MVQAENHPITRRSLISGATAATSAGVLATPGVSQSNDDNELLAL
jgi:hypothetical protein